MEDVLHLDAFAVEAQDLSDVHDLAAAVAQPHLMDDEVDRRCDLLADRPRGQLGACHQHHGLETGEHVARGVGVHRGERAVVAGVHRLEHVQRLATATLADDDAIGPHSQAVDDQLADVHRAAALDIGRPGLEGDHVLLAELELGRVLDGDDALVVGDERAEDVQRGRLSGAGAAAHHHVHAAGDAGAEAEE